MDRPWLRLPQSSRDLEERNINRAYYGLRLLAAEKEVGPLKLHCTRHTFETLALEAGTNPKWVSQVLGHHSVASTLEVYVPRPRPR